MDAVNIYVSGPMTGCFALNFPRFGEAAKTLRDAGADVFNPAEAAEQAGLNPAKPTAWTPEQRAALTKKCVHNLCGCDAICLLPGWEQSAGSKHELSVALAMNLEVLLYESTP